MKKLLILCTIAFTVACSNEQTDLKNESTQTNEVTANQVMSITSEDQPTIDDEIDQMFYNYVNSQEYLNVENAHNSFFSKLNYSGNYENIKKHSTLILWVENNFTLTNFTSINEAKTELNNLINLEQIKEETFTTLFTFIKTAPIEQVVYRFNKWFPTNINETLGEKECLKNFKNCMNEVSTQYQLEIRTNYASDCSMEDILIANRVSKQTYQDGMQSCKDSWNACRNPRK